MRDVLVLCYHAVSPRWDSDLSVTPDVFDRQVRFLLDRGWRATTFADAVLSPAPERTLAITFDDAFASVRSHAAPVLKRLGVPATVFAPTGFIGKDRLEWPEIAMWRAGPHADELKPASWEDLRALADAGWEIGSHTLTHPHLTRISDDELERELSDSRDECERRLGRPCQTIAYPYGEVDSRVAEVARRLEYQAGASLGHRLESLGPFRFPRIGVYPGDVGWRFRAKVVRPVRALRASSVWPL